MFSEINGQRLMSYGALDFEMSTSQTERLLMQENLLLRQSCHQLMYQVDQLTRARDHVNTQFHTFHLLYVQLKHDRNRIARQLTSVQRELEHLKRAQVLTNQIALGHHPLDNYRRKHPNYYRSLKTAGNRKSARRFRRTQSAKYISQENLPAQSTYKRFDTLNEYPQCQVTQIEQQWSPITADNVERLIQPGGSNSPLLDESYQHFGQIEPLVDNHFSEYSLCSDGDCEFQSKRPKLGYRDSLRQCVEFSRSLLDLSKRHIVGAEVDDSDHDDNDNNAMPENIDIDQAKQIETAQSVEEEPINVKMVHQCVSTNSLLDVPKPLVIEDIAETKTQSIALQTDVAIEEARAMEPCKLECAPIEFASADSLVVNLSYISNCTTYLREVRLQNKPKDFLGIFFESAFSNGVVVQQLVPNSIADRAGVRQGDRVLEICGINMRKANFRMANKIIQECETDLITLKVVSSDAVFNMPMYSGEGGEHPALQASSSSSSTDTAEENGFRRIRPLRKTCTLTRREAFKNKSKLHSYFERKNGKEAMMYQTCHLTVELPRRINVTEPLAKIKLLGGNAVGIFVHSIGDDFLANLLRTGDQLLEYNNFDLTKATAEDAARELAKPARNNGVLVALFNMDAYNQIQEMPTGDSFYIRAEFSRTSVKNSLDFKKGDILYVDNTLYDGKPGYWRAWQVDEFGQKRACGLIPSKYNAQCELLKQIRSQSYGSRWHRFKFFSIPYRIFFWKTKTGYTKLNEKRQESAKILASCTISNYSPLEDSRDEEPESVSVAPAENSLEGKENAKSYQLVNMLPLQNTPRPVLIYGPFSHIIAQRLEAEFAHLYRMCSRQSITVDTDNEPCWEQYLHCTTAKDTIECIALADITETVGEGLHPVISVVSNTVSDFRSHQLFPIVIGLKFRSAKHIKETVNKWKINEHPRAVCYKMAKTSYNHQLKCEHEFKDATDIRITGNNLTYMCTQIKDRVREEQNKVVWKETEQ